MNNQSNKIPKPTCPNLEVDLLEKDSKVLKQLGQGTYGITFRGCYDTACSLKQGIKLASIKKRIGFNDDIKHPANIEINAGKELSKYVNNGETPHINRILESFRCSVTDLKKLKSFKDTDWMKETISLLQKNEIYPYVNIYFMDVGTMDLHKFIKLRCEKKSLQFEEIIDIFFQVMYTLTIIQQHLKDYKHNDLKTNNLLVKVNGDNLERDFNSYSICDEYNNAGKRFYVPFRGYTVKIIDFDFTYSQKFQNAKITSFKKTNFKYIGYSPAVNPVFDTHFFLNSFYNSEKIMNCLPKFKKLIETLLEPDYRGSQAKYIERNKLTSYYVNGVTNYVPPNMLTPIELIHFTNYFKRLEKQYDLKIRNQYTTVFTSISSKLRKRKDMFNVFLRGTDEQSLDKKETRYHKQLQN